VSSLFDHEVKLAEWLETGAAGDGGADERSQGSQHEPMWRVLSVLLTIQYQHRAGCNIIAFNSADQ
jgi:hypothetical protein